MKEVQGNMDEVPISYFGRTLTAVCGHIRPDKSLIQSLQCTRLEPRKLCSTLKSFNVSTRTSYIHGTEKSCFVPYRKKEMLRNTTVISEIKPHENGFLTWKSTFKDSATLQIDSHVTSEIQTPNQSRNHLHSAVSRHSEATVNIQQNSRSMSGINSHRPLSCRTYISSASRLTSTKSNSNLVHDLNLTSTGLSIWCVERSSEGDTNLHVWNGSKSCQWEGFETGVFHSYFTNGIIIVEGKSIATSVKSFNYVKRLYHVKGRQFPSATCIESSALSVTDDNLIILDGYPRMYVCIGKNVDYIIRQKLAQMMNVQQRINKGQIIVIDENDEHLKEIFVKKLGLNTECDRLSSEERFDEVLPQETLKLFKLTGSRYDYDMPLVTNYPLSQRYLTTQDNFLLLIKPTQPVYIWVGSCADSTEALLYGEIFMQSHNFPSTTPLCRIKENKEPLNFKKYFTDWKENIKKNPAKAIHSYTIGNIERLLQQNSESQFSGKLKEIQEEFSFLEFNIMYKVLLIGESLISLTTERYVAFDRHNCYLIICQNTDGENTNRVIYYWLGEKVSDNKRKKAQQVALECKSYLKQNCIIIRVLEGKEPKHFLKALNSCFIVYDADPLQDLTVSEVYLNLCNGKVMMFCVRESHNNAVTLSQVEPYSKNLNSSSSFLIISNTIKYLWYGKNSSALQREYAKIMMSRFYPQRSHDYSIVTEGRETNLFWSCVTKDGECQRELSKKIICHGRQSRLIMCSQKHEKWFFKDIEDFSHAETLHESDMYILDTQDCIILWIGHTVNEAYNDNIFSVIDAYIYVDVANRQESDLEIWILDQSDEPHLFTNLLTKSCSRHSSFMYHQERTKIKAQNSQINAISLVNNSNIRKFPIPYKKLLKRDNLDESVNQLHLEEHLTDDEFYKVFRMNRSDFYYLPRWKQLQILKFTRLFSAFKQF
ncbi:hypothetical protein Btru_027422 [Bulinus truncatus]|nr:hypothetical protein Btru_027422 [Bulinus truncatus]